MLGRQSCRPQRYRRVRARPDRILARDRAPGRVPSVSRGTGETATTLREGTKKDAACVTHIATGRTRILDRTGRAAERRVSSTVAWQGESAARSSRVGFGDHGCGAHGFSRSRSRRPREFAGFGHTGARFSTCDVRVRCANTTGAMARMGAGAHVIARICPPNFCDRERVMSDPECVTSERERVTSDRETAVHSHESSSWRVRTIAGRLERLSRCPEPIARRSHRVVHPRRHVVAAPGAAALGLFAVFVRPRACERRGVPA